MNDRALPVDLRIVAWLFFYVGMDALAHDLILLRFGHLVLPRFDHYQVSGDLGLLCIPILPRFDHYQVSGDLGLLCIPVFFGLLRRNEGFRILALILLALGFRAIPAVALVVQFHHLNSGAFMFFGHRLFGIPLSVMPFYFGVTLLLMAWEWRVLTRPGVTAVFRHRSPAASPLASVSTA